jgi:hypothetical protein
LIRLSSKELTSRVPSSVDFTNNRLSSAKKGVIHCRGSGGYLDPLEMWWSTAFFGGQKGSLLQGKIDTGI